jgi:hypothetical protein
MIKLLNLDNRQIYTHVGDAEAEICKVTDIVDRLLGIYYMCVVVKKDK